MNQIKLKRVHDGAILPAAANVGDALDLFAPQEYILEPHVPAEAIKVTEELSATARGVGGFGSTGK